MYYRNYVFKSDSWTGPTSNIWNDDQCDHKGYINPGSGVSTCKESCKTTVDCNAFNFNVLDTSCILRKCAYPVPSPLWDHANHEGYHLGTKMKPVQIR